MDALEFRDKVRNNLDELITLAFESGLAPDVYSAQLYVARVANEWIGDDYIRRDELKSYIRKDYTEGDVSGEPHNYCE